MNISLILSGGVGKRFGADIPKQYCKINGKPVIDYVIEACLNSKKTDKIVVVCDPTFIEYSDILKNNTDIVVVSNGKERLDSLDNGLQYIKNNFQCKNVCIFDAVAPLVYPELIDTYFELLNKNDCVITSQKITGELGNYNNDILLRDDYYITQSPEAFDFNLLMKHFDKTFYSTELANQLPKDSKRYLYFDFKQNLKITYDFELKYISHILECSNHQ